MEKQKLISKFNIKDYGSELEKILLRKDFSEDVKNLLLSMLYKVETSYNDYSLVIGEAKQRKEILEEIIENISICCNKIEIIKDKKSKSSQEEGKITTYPDVSKMLYEIYQIGSNKFSVPEKHDVIKKSLEETLNQGYSIASSEIIRDFDGWSWNILKDEIENYDSNLIYQTIKMLVGNEVLVEWQQSNEQDYVEILKTKLNEIYNEKLGEKLFNILCETIILNNIKSNNEEKERLIDLQQKLQSDFEQFDDKKKYLDTLIKQKEKIIDKIKNIEGIVDDDRKLKNEFIERNEKLEINKRIFSLSDFVEVLEKEKTNLLKDLKNCIKKMEPLNFLKTKEEIQEKLALLKAINLNEDSKKIYKTKMKEMLQLWLDAIKVKIENEEEKEKIIKLIYQIRYYSLIYVNKNKQVKDIIDINKLQRVIITKACNLKFITIFSKDIKENYEIIKNILQTNIIELKNMYFEFVVKDKKIILEIYDEDNVYKEIEFNELQDLNVRFNKRIKVFN